MYQLLYLYVFISDGSVLVCIPHIPPATIQATDSDKMFSRCHGGHHAGIMTFHSPSLISIYPRGHDILERGRPLQIQDTPYPTADHLAQVVLCLAQAHGLLDLYIIVSTVYIDREF